MSDDEFKIVHKKFTVKLPMVDMGVQPTAEDVKKAIAEQVAATAKQLNTYLTDGPPKILDVNGEPYLPLPEPTAKGVWNTSGSVPVWDKPFTEADLFACIEAIKNQPYPKLPPLKPMYGVGTLPVATPPKPRPEYHIGFMSADDVAEVRRAIGV